MKNKYKENMGFVTNRMYKNKQNRMVCRIELVMGI